MNNIITTDKTTSRLNCIKMAKDGLFLEFGVAEGASIREIAGNTNNPVYGFDSFEGLPEAWHGMGIGHFRCSVPVNLPENVTLVKGLFQDTLVNFLNETSGDISFVHIDCDLYSSTKYVFDCIKDRIINECIICFDEIDGYDTWEEHEYKAFKEFLEETKYTFEIIGRYGAHQIGYKIFK